MSNPPFLKLDQALGHDVVDRRMQILRQVHELGSISQAARAVGLSYKAAWQALDTLGNLAGQPVIESTAGGAGGGGARLTAAGKELLRAHELMMTARKSVLTTLADQMMHGASGQSSGGAALALSWLGLRTSMRNHLPCCIRQIRHESGAVRVELVLPDGQPLQSMITRHSAQILGIVPGMQVLALFKATAARIFSAHSTTRDLQLQGQFLQGRLTTQGYEGDTDATEPVTAEATVALGQDQKMTGFASEALKPGESVRVMVDPAAVVLVLPG